MKKSKFEISKVYTIRWKKIGIRKSEFVTKTQFLYKMFPLFPILFFILNDAFHPTIFTNTS